MTALLLQEAALFSFYTLLSSVFRRSNFLCPCIILAWLNFITTPLGSSVYSALVVEFVLMVQKYSTVQVYETS